MIEASIGALPGLIPAFLIVMAIIGLPMAVWAKVKGESITLSLLFAAALAGVFTVTLTPGSGGPGQAGVCDTGLPGWEFLESESARLNVLLFIPLSLLGVLRFQRPVSMLAGSLTLTCGVELVQSAADLGRACSYDDIKANSLGALIGLAVGTTILWLKKRKNPFNRRDFLWGVCVGTLMAASVGATFRYAIKSIDAEVSSRARQAKMGEMALQDDWLQGVTQSLFGSNATVEGSQSKKLANGHWRIEAETTGGNLTALWPEKKIEKFSAHLSGANKNPSPLPESDARSTGELFAQKWFPEGIAGAKVNARKIEGKGGGYLLTYRRFVGGVMMPMRLDLVITSAGKVTGMSARSVPDPKLPDVTIGRSEAKIQAEQINEDVTATPVRLLAQKVKTVWRPVWMVGLSEAPGHRDVSTVFIDAVSGKEVTPDPLEDQDTDLPHKHS
ncbi:VanZ family protein [Streptomyces sp. NPDC093707]|uniref:VanZ family protein n=1 Tax=Streptomyces sp. NPDC093707 TaxID=3154984 RepID=UPI00344C286C